MPVVLEMGLQFSFLVLQVDRQLVVDIVEHREDRGVLVLVALSQGVSDFFANFSSFVLLIRHSLNTDIIQKLCQSLDGIFLGLPDLSFGLVSIKSRVV